MAGKYNIPPPFSVSVPSISTAKARIETNIYAEKEKEF
jgi:hypothetical protein